ncbi:MAG: DUF6015 family protein [Thermoplasmata archaeon]
MEIDLNIVTRDLLYLALSKILKKKGMNEMEIYEITDYLLSFFGFDDYIVDNILTPIDRDIFYYLEECGILKTESMEVNLLKGRQWRIHMWAYRKEKIKEIIVSKEVKEIDDPKKIYEKIFNERIE